MVPSLLPIIVDNRDGTPPSVACCIGYEMSKWRAKKLVKLILDSLPEFVLTEEEIADLSVLSPYSTLEKSIPFFTNPNNPSSGGEIGELLAHKILSRDFHTEQLVKRLRYKMRSRDAVTGFDIVHIRVDESGELELWLGESKFFSKRSTAIQKAIASLNDHIDSGILTERKSLIGPKISRSSPHFDKLQWLFHEDTNLDEIISRMVVPVFIASDTKITTVGELPTDYLNSVTVELAEIASKVQAAHGHNLDFVFLYVPLNNKDTFDGVWATKLSAFA